MLTLQQHVLSILEPAAAVPCHVLELAGTSPCALHMRLAARLACMNSWLKRTGCGVCMAFVAGLGRMQPHLKSLCGRHCGPWPCRAAFTVRNFEEHAASARFAPTLQLRLFVMTGCLKQEICGAMLWVPFDRAHSPREARSCSGMPKTR